MNWLCLGMGCTQNCADLFLKIVFRYVQKIQHHQLCILGRSTLCIDKLGCRQTLLRCVMVT